MNQEKKEKKEKINSQELEKKLQECFKKKEEYLAGWQRERADFLNYKKEEMERIDKFLQYAGEEFILKILPVLDNFEIAENKINPDFKNNENVKGLLQIKNQILDFLKNEKVEEIKTIDQKFDPALHEAIGHVEIKGKESGIIVEEVQKGYKINGRLLRPARVKVSK